VGTVVTFCYTVSNYAQNGADWLAGITPIIGPAWVPGSLQPVTAAPSCDGLGTWAWYPSCFGTASGVTSGPGFYYDTPSGSPGGVADGIPGNNFGDNCLNGTWTFCFSVEVGQCLPGGSSSLYVGVMALSDYTAGSWGTNACIDPPYSYGTITCVNACALIVPTVTIVDATCHNSNDGSITPVPSGVAPYTYLWSNGATTQTISNLPPGIYTLTVTDSIGCEKVVTFPVGGPQPIVLNETIVDNSCDPDDASITLAPSGGTGTIYTYQWSNGGTGSSITDLTGGTYTVTVTDSNNCAETATYTITTVVPIDIITSSTSTGCTGADGTATANVTGGLPPYTYDWQPVGGNGPVASNLPAGTYTVTVTDTNGCTSTGQAVVQAIGTFTLTSTFVPLACDPLGTTSASVTVNGGTAPFTYQWSPFGGNQASATGLTSGTYVVLVTDSNNCIDSVTIVIPSVIPVTLTTSSTAVQCNQPNSGTATASPAGGTSPYTYIWSDGSSAATAVNLAGGTFTVTVTDVNGCSATETIVVDVIPDVFAAAGTDQFICNGDAANLSGSASGGTAPFSFSWDNGFNGPDQTVSPVTTTTYILTVTDANSCTATSTMTVTVIDYPVVTMSPDDDICAGSSTQLQASGGASYSWSPYDGLSDPNIANPIATPDVTTTYTVTVSNGQCSSTGTVTINVAPEVIAAFSVDTTTGQAPLTVNFTNNSSNSDSWFWDFGDGITSFDENPTHSYTEQGSYEVVLIATNSLGCNDTIRFAFIIVETKSLLVIPNVFTPNNDNLNDVFSFEEIGISSLKSVILNRWGREVYSWNNPGGSWNGKSKDGSEVPEGVYIYVITAQGIDGKAYNFEGTVQLIRNKK
jgi:gliding motility-associated-like protein